MASSQATARTGIVPIESEGMGRAPSARGEMVKVTETKTITVTER